MVAKLKIIKVLCIKSASMQGRFLQGFLAPYYYKYGPFLLKFAPELVF